MNIPKYYRYLVVFEDQLDNSTPVLKLHDLSAIKYDNRNRMHLLDDDIVSIIPILEYCLHLPRNEFDVCDTDARILDKSYDTSHDILVCPVSHVHSVIVSWKPDLVIYDDFCFDKIADLIEINNQLIFTPKSNLSSKSLRDHWRMMFNRRNIKMAEEVPDLDCQYILDEEKMLFLPMLFTARQYGQVNRLYNRIFNSTDVFEECTTVLYNQNFHHNALMSIADVDSTDIDQIKEIYEQGKQSAQNNTRINLVITYPGVSPYQIKKAGLSNQLPEAEQKIIRIVGIHRAIAKNAVLMELPIITKELFELINELELYSKQLPGPNNRYVQRTLSKMGDCFEYMLSHSQKWALHNAKQVTVLSDFPLGLCVFDGNDTPLQCEKIFSARALSPLTRTIQIELIKHPQLYLGNGCTVLFVECVPDSDDNLMMCFQR